MLTTADRFSIFQNSNSAFRAQITFLGITMCLLQVADGILTAIGVGHFGIDMEGNVLIRSIMTHYGINTALILTKGLAILIIISLCRLSYKVSWVSSALTLLVPVYLAAAVVPWTWIICTKILFV